MPALEEGQKFERYRVIRLLGQGVAGISYEAEDMMLRRHVVLKLIHPWSPLPDSARRQFFRDMQSISLFAHPYQATTLDYGEVDGQLYVVRRFVPAGSLLNNDGRTWFAPPLAISAAINYTHQIAQALYNIHRYGHIHGSLTLSNLLVLQSVDHNVEQEAAPFLLSDVGMAHFVRRFGHPQIARLPVTSAPEQARGRVVPASDQYALAAILYFWLAGRPPFFGSPDEIHQAKRVASFPVLSTQNPQVTFELEGVIRRALSAYPEERYPTVLAFAEALRATFAHSQPRPTPTTQQQPDQPAISRPPMSTTEPLEVSIILPPTGANAAEETARILVPGKPLPTEYTSMSGTFLIDQQTLSYLTELTQEDDKSPLEPMPKEAEQVRKEPETDAEPVSGTFVLNQETLRLLTMLAQQDTAFEKPGEAEPLPEIELNMPLLHLDTSPCLQLNSAPGSEQALASSKESVAVPTSVSDIAQPLPQIPETLPLPAGLTRPLELLPPDERGRQEPSIEEEKINETSPSDPGSRSTDPLPSLIGQRVVLPQLTLTSPSMTTIEEFTLTHEKTTLGRAGSNDIVLDKGTMASRRHAYILREGKRYTIYDDDSIHGVIVNEEKLTPGIGHPLSDGDQIRIGEYEITFHMKVTQYISHDVLMSGENILS